MDVDKLKEAMKEMKSNHVKPRQIFCQKEIDEMNDLNEALGLDRDFKIGDRVYTAYTSFGLEAFKYDQ